jgi:maltose alpha-D-glucosyltransferase/alpha-amylase
MPRMYMAIAKEDRFPITDIMRQTPEIPENAQWAIFLRNHDELTLEMVTDEERDYLWNTYASDKRARINLGIRRRLAPLLQRDRRRIELMNGLLLSMPGTPVVYYGDEIGMGDNIHLGDRDGVRTPMQWTEDRNGGFSRADPASVVLPPIMDPLYGFNAVNVEAQARDSSSLLNWTKRMLAVRKTSRAFGRGKRVFLKPGNRKILAYLSIYEDDTILSVFNLSRAAQPVELDLSAYKGSVLVEMLGRTSFPPVGDLPYLLTLPSFGFYWFRITANAEVPVWHQEGASLQDRPTLVLFDGWTTFFRERVMPWRMGMADRMRAQFELDTLPRFVETQRWFASKGTTVERARVTDYAMWEQGELSYMLPIVKLDGMAEESTYFMPLALAWEDSEEDRVTCLTPAALAKIRQQANVGVMGDAFYDPDFCRALVASIGSGKELPSNAGRMVFAPTAVFSQHASDIAEMTVSRPSAASSNTVVTLNETLFLKGYRRLRDGLNPELEMGRFLTEVARYPNCVPVLGALEYFGKDGSVITLAMVQGYVANQGDGWDNTLGYVERFLEEMRTDTTTVGGVPANEAHGGWLARAATLGQRTAELHLALAIRSGDAAFDPEPLTAADIAGYRQRAAAEAARTIELLRERGAALPALVQDDARAVLAMQAALQSRIGATTSAQATAPGAGLGSPANSGIAAGALSGTGSTSGSLGIKTRYHGDYHLGQVLVTGNDFVIIDFEGEPARTFEERRTKSSPLRDVAGMLRSFNYVRWTALRRVAQSPAELDKLEPAVREWEMATREAFLVAYSQTMAAAPHAVPVDLELLALFELEKSLYELRYELNNRVDWAQVPLQGVIALMKAAPH